MQPDARENFPGDLPSTVASEVRCFVVQSLGRNLGDSEKIFSGGPASSLFGLQLILFIEKSFAIEVTDDDLVLDNFSSIENIARFVSRKLRATNR